jgi:hypothetical protein
LDAVILLISDIHVSGRINKYAIRPVKLISRISYSIITSHRYTTYGAVAVTDFTGEAPLYQSIFDSEPEVETVKVAPAQLPVFFNVTGNGHWEWPI